MHGQTTEQRRPYLKAFAFLALLIALGLTAGAAVAGLPAGQAASLPAQSGVQGQVTEGATGYDGPASADPFSIQIIDSTVITCNTVITGAINGTEPQQTGRLFRDDPGTTCEVPTTCEPFDTVQRYYDSYTFVNESGATACVFIYLENRCGLDTSLQSAAYLGTFNPANLCANILGDIGETPNNTFGKQYSVSVPAGATLVVTVNESGTLLCPEYRLVVAGDYCGGSTPTPGPATATPTTAPPTATATAPAGTATATSTGTVTVPSATATSGASTATPTSCTIEFTDVPVTNTFYPFVRCLACQGIITGYPCGGEFEPCNANNDPYFRPNNPVTRGQIAKIISLSAGFNEVVPPTQQSFEDVVYGSTFWEFIERLYTRNIIGGYQCGINPAEPCIPPDNRPYFRPNAGATR
ncbi:MAG TPA: S-layer homology domain-containing protein, partial [Chloroflexia bacterium]|nr:S-layer homology domain-containing protein [Chloroflexia bacterium]